MNCRSCNVGVSPGAKYCRNCFQHPVHGSTSDVPEFCSNCDTLVNPGQISCTGCHHSLYPPSPLDDDGQAGMLLRDALGLSHVSSNAKVLKAVQERAVAVTTFNAVVHADHKKQRKQHEHLVGLVHRHRDELKRCAERIEAARVQFKAITSDFPGLTGPLVDLFKDPD